jgi:hypothetical protein
VAALGVERFHPGDKQWKLLLLAWAVVGGAVVAVDVVTREVRPENKCYHYTVL